MQLPPCVLTFNPPTQIDGHSEGTCEQNDAVLFDNGWRANLSSDSSKSN